MRIVDTHCHLDLYPSPSSVISELEKFGIIAIGMTNLPSHFEMGYKHTRNLRCVRLAMGMHPLMASHHAQELPLFMKNLSLTSYIGEVGLDFSNEGIGTKNIQLNSFEQILSQVSGKKKLLSIHSRKAEKEVLELLKKYKIKNAIFHWYSGGLKIADEIVNTGYSFSINTAMIKSINGQKIINRIPKELILTETDGPFINYDERTVQSKDIKVIIEHLDNLPQFDRMENQIFQNYMNLIEQLK